MKSDWKIKKLSDVADLTVGFVGSMVEHYVEKGVVFLRSTNIAPFQINLNDVKFISPEFNEKIRKSELKTGDVVIVRTGKPGACAVVPETKGPWNCSDLVIVRPNIEEVHPLYIASYINLASGVINAHLVGAVQQHFNVGVAKRMELAIPPLIIQKKIVGVIEIIDCKIKINGKINDNLSPRQSLITAEKVSCGDNEETATQFSSLLAA